MLSCYKMLSLLSLIMLIAVQNHRSFALPLAEIEVRSPTDDPKFVVIKEDVIPDIVEMDQKKVIRVNPLDLPPIKEDPNKASADSSLYKIQPVQPYKGKRKYVNSTKMRKPQPQETTSVAKPEDPSIVQALPVEHKFVKSKHQPKKKHLHFLYNQEDLSKRLISKTMPVHTAPGAYPVFYGISRANGSFGKYPLKSFGTLEAFMKYLHKNKFENVKLLQ